MWTLKSITAYVIIVLCNVFLLSWWCFRYLCYVIWILLLLVLLLQWGVIIVLRDLFRHDLIYRYRGLDCERNRNQRFRNRMKLIRVSDTDGSIRVLGYCKSRGGFRLSSKGVVSWELRVRDYILQLLLKFWIFFILLLYKLMCYLIYFHEFR